MELCKCIRIEVDAALKKDEIIAQLGDELSSEQATEVLESSGPVSINLQKKGTGVATVA